MLSAATDHSEQRERSLGVQEDRRAERDAGQVTRACLRSAVIASGDDQRQPTAPGEPRGVIREPRGHVLAARVADAQGVEPPRAGAVQRCRRRSCASRRRVRSRARSAARCARHSRIVIPSGMSVWT